MCGIAGTYGPAWSDAESASLLAAIAHRGHDGVGHLRTGPLSIGMCRLNLRGPEAPLPIQTARGVGALNGQIYAVETLRGGFRSLPEGLEREFAAVANPRVKPDGMYAAAIGTSDGKSLALVTDRDAIKPLFYRTRPEGLAFCSELPPLARLSPSTLNADALADLFSFGWYTGDQTYLDDIRQVARSNVAATRAATIETAKTRPRDRDGRPTSGDIRQAIAASVRACAGGRGRFGLAVSGGVDSTILAYELSAAGVDDLCTFSVRIAGDGVASLAELGLPEGPWRRWTHRVLEPDWGAEFLGRFDEGVRRFGQPTTMSSLVLIDAISAAAADEGVSVLLTGEGVDEYFGGYAEYASFDEADPLLSFYVRPARDRIARALLGDELVDAAHRRFEMTYADASDLRDAERDLRLSRLLLRTDISLMARTIEGRVPFLHRGIPEQGLAIPWKEAVRAPGKAPLREAYAGPLGSRAHRAKQRFKVGDRPLRAPFVDGAVRSRIHHNLAEVFSPGRLATALELLGGGDTFEADSACLVLSLSSLAESGAFIGHLA